MKKCSVCQLTKDEADFYKRLGDTLRADCKACFDFRLAAKKYGLSVEQLRTLYVAQEAKCAICGEYSTETRNLAVDHDHSCCPGKKSCGLCVRGLLCAKCNQGLGTFKDDPERLRRAADYVERTNALVQKRLGI